MSVSPAKEFTITAVSLMMTAIPMVMQIGIFGFNPQEQQASVDRVTPAAPITSDIADLERRECEGRIIATSSHYSQDNLGTLRTSGFRRPAESTQEVCPDGAAGEISREIESAKRCFNWVATVLGARGYPKST